MLRLISLDGTIYGEEGRMLHFSVQRFIDDVVKGGCCFMCGRTASASVPFNGEHVVPNWLLRRCKLHGQRVTIPGGQSIAYSRYKVPCCVHCNGELGRLVEVPVSKLLEGGMRDVAPRLDNPRAGKLLYCWLALLFLKMHLKDLKMRMTADPRKSEFNVGDVYDWSRLQHVQSIARCPLIGADIRDLAVGTCIIREIWCPPQGAYDYGNFSFAYTSLLQLHDMAIFAVLDDAKMCETVVQSDFADLGVLVRMQARELLAHLAYVNMRIEEKAKLKTWLDPDSGEMYVEAEVGNRFTLNPFDAEKYGLMFDYATADVEVPDEIRAQIRAGRGSFVFDQDGFVSRVISGPLPRELDSSVTAV